MIRCSKCLKTWTLQQLGWSTATSSVRTFWCPDCDPEKFKHSLASKEEPDSSTATRPN